MIAVSFLLLLPIWSNVHTRCDAFSMAPTKSKRTSARTIVENRGPKRTRAATAAATATATAASSLSSLFANTINEDEESSTLKSTSALSTSKESHALEVFERHASDGAYEGQKFISKAEQLLGVLVSLDLDATLEDADIVFRFLDTDGDGRLLFKDEFLPWYLDAVQQAAEISRVFQSMLIGRRTVDEFDKTPVDDAILERAVQCAMAAPNRSCSEPWRFLSVGPSTVEKLAVLNADRTTADAEEGKFTRFTDWNSVAPGWCVVTTQRDNTKTDDDDDDDDSINDDYLMSAIEQDTYKSVCCSVQNFMLSMWSEGIGTKWTTGAVQKTPEFADICGIDRSKERVVGIVWYGYATGGTKYADPRRRKLSVDDVLGYLP